MTAPSIRPRCAARSPPPPSRAASRATSGGDGLGARPVRQPGPGILGAGHRGSSGCIRAGRRHCGVGDGALARAGFTGPEPCWKAARLLCRPYPEIPTGDDLPSHDLGENVAGPGIALKPYPCCHFIHGFSDAASSCAASSTSPSRAHRLPATPRRAQDGRRAPRALHPAHDALRGDVQRPVRHRRWRWYGAGSTSRRSSTSRSMRRRCSRWPTRPTACPIRRATIPCIFPARSSSI